MDDQGAEKSAQAYQVLGALLVGEPIQVSEEEAIRALDYFADEAAFDEEFLPWPW